ncbi:glycosyltransferase family 4 protein [Pseudoxanthomonas daejeonensis]|uniref:glycosyltransferase n=1 Tax=Pseudoxanthomonas daejeonensis TaxID=266062 RepID=UPI001F543DDD|nr:glycosyltransferase [Pseudoxanthomonas daejeonensis]UNK56465.1 glycosyltransferase family 4 protein [Pseudoxanthomonas daejeonensis]
MRGLWHSLTHRGVRATLLRAWRFLIDRAGTGTGQASLQPSPVPLAGNSSWILVLDALMPDPTRDSGSVRMHEILTLIHELGWSVAFAPDSGRATESEKNAMVEAGIAVIGVAGTPSLPDWLEAHGDSLAAAMFCRHEVASAHIDLVRAAAPGARVLFDTVDLHSLREERTARLSGDRALLRRARRSWRVERDLAARSDVTFVVSPVEQELLQAELPDARIELLSNIHSVAGTSMPFDGRHGVLFVGGFAHPPNRDAAYWLVEEILPLIHRHSPGMPLHLVGAIPDHERDALQREHVHIHGQVADLAPWMDQCLLAAAPLRSGAGVKGKVNSAMSHGLPVVATHMAAEGMHLEDGHDVLLADTAEQFAACVARLAREPLLWARLSANGQDNIQRHFSRQCARRALQSALPPLPPRSTSH